MTTDRRKRNEHLFRAANLAIQHNRYSPPDELLVFLCECSDGECSIDIELTLAEYNSLRRNDRRFAVMVGHEDLSIECVVDEFDRYTIVEK